MTNSLNVQTTLLPFNCLGSRILALFAAVTSTPDSRVYSVGMVEGPSTHFDFLQVCLLDIWIHF